jgi:hypothetical protein
VGLLLCLFCGAIEHISGSRVLTFGHDFGCASQLLMTLDLSVHMCVICETKLYSRVLCADFLCCQW